MKIVSYPIENGQRYVVADTAHVDITNDQRFFTVYDTYWQPIGTIIRPAVLGGNRKWESHLADGSVCTISAIGPRSAFKDMMAVLR